MAAHHWEPCTSRGRPASVGLHLPSGPHSLPRAPFSSRTNAASRRAGPPPGSGHGVCHHLKPSSSQMPFLPGTLTLILDFWRLPIFSCNTSAVVPSLKEAPILAESKGGGGCWGQGWGKMLHLEFHLFLLYLRQCFPTKRCCELGDL